MNSQPTVMASRFSRLRRAAALSLRAFASTELPCTGRATSAALDLAAFNTTLQPPSLRAWHPLSRHCSDVATSLNTNSSTAALSSEDPRQAVYRLEIVTGDVRGAGTPAPALITLYGENGHSESHVIGAEEADHGFARATRKTYYVYSKNLGALRRVHLQLGPNAGSSEEGMPSGWYLDRVEVTGPGNERLTFPCGAWLGRSKEEAGGFGQVAGCEERNLIPIDPMRSSLADPSYRPLSRPMRIVASGCAIPQAEKAQAGNKGANRKGYGHAGEDAYFYASNTNGVFAVGIADGVYAWRRRGIDAGDWSRKLMRAARFSVEAGTTDVLRVVQAAVRSLNSEGVQGSSTMCIILVDTLQGRLAAANIGDSGFLVLSRRRDGRASGGTGSLRLRHRSPQQEHSFGHPYQLGHHAAADKPEDAMLSTMPVYPGDVLVLGSDGLFDNLSDDDILEIVRLHEKVLQEAQQPAAVAQALAFAAFEASIDRDKATPYSEAASAAFDMVYSGGKQDDITVVVCQIT
jgi:protein phosphatase PTC7